MSGEVWTPTSDVGIEVMPTNWPNIIQDNLSVLRRGDGYSTIETATEAVSLTLPNEYDRVFNLSLTNAGINYISTNGRQLGNEITLIVSGTLGSIVCDQTVPGVGFARIHIYNISVGDINNLILYAGMVIKLTLGVFEGNLCWMMTY